MEVDSLLLDKQDLKKIRLRRILFDPPIKDRRHYENSRLYLEISGKKGRERKMSLQDYKKGILEVRYFKNGETQQELYARVEESLRGYHQGENPSLPSDFLGKLFSNIT